MSIDIRLCAASHSLYWFNECGRDEGETNVSYCIEGTVAFENLEVLRADTTPQPLHEFISEGQTTGRPYTNRMNGLAGRPSELLKAARIRGGRTCGTERRPSTRATLNPAERTAALVPGQTGLVPQPSAHRLPDGRWPAAPIDRSEFA